MSGGADLTDLIVLILVSLIPALIYLSWVRRTERYRTESWGPLLWAFVYGAIFATIVAGVLEGILVAVGTPASGYLPGPAFVCQNENSPAGAFFLVLVIAPFIEEALKASGVAANRRRLRMLADGPVFGASVGLGLGVFEAFGAGLGGCLRGGRGAG